MPKRTANKPLKAFWEMTAQELADGTKEFDKPTPASRFRTLTKSGRARFERSRQSPMVSAQIRGKLRRQVLVELDVKTLRRCEAYAKRHKISLPKMIDRGLRGLLAFAE